MAKKRSSLETVHAYSSLRDTKTRFVPSPLGPLKVKNAATGTDFVPSRNRRAPGLPWKHLNLKEKSAGQKMGQTSEVHMAVTMWRHSQRIKESEVQELGKHAEQTQKSGKVVNIWGHKVAKSVFYGEFKAIKTLKRE